MKNRIWYELCQRKHNNFYCISLLAQQKRALNNFNIAILIFSTAGVMGWKVWANFPVTACFIVSAISLLKLISPHIIPSERSIDKLNKIVDFQFGYYNNLEQLWYDHFNSRITDEQAQIKFYELKETEREINIIINELIKSTNKRILKKTDSETRQYLRLTFNLQTT